VQTVAGVVQHYPWGDPEFIPALLGVPADGRPWAELWLGTHPSGPAQLATGGRPLAELTGDLSYLLKVLSADQPLSLQTHPDSTQARAGYERGDYPDPNPKPELLVALTPFEALCGFRPVDDTLTLLDELGAHDLRDMLASSGIDGTLAALYRGRLDPRSTIDTCAASQRPEAAWVRRLDTMYPAEPSVAVTLLLNLVTLAPGEAVRLDAGNLHAYLRGSGVELMAASDNVIRGGLTVKPIDVDDLLATVDTTTLADPVIPVSDRYELAAAGVALVRVDAEATHTSRGHELFVALDGTTGYLAPGEPFTATTTTFVATPIDA
jgi:mannose-6-phosphate isomerase